MREVSRTLFIPLYGKAAVSQKKIILNDPDAERIWNQEQFPIHGKSASIWLAYNMAMRARVFDDWTDEMLETCPDALVLHVGCGLDSRCHRVTKKCRHWIDCDLEEVIEVRRQYFTENEHYAMRALNACAPEEIKSLADSETAIVVLEGLSMYLTPEELHDFLKALEEKYPKLHILMDVYTVLGAKLSKYRNPVNEVGVSRLYGTDEIETLISDLRIRFVKEHSFTPEYLVKELSPMEQKFFRFMFTGSLYGKIYRLLELAG